MFTVVQKKIFIGGMGVLGLILLISLFKSPTSTTRVLKRPLLALVGTSEDLPLGVLEVSGHIDPLEQATRRLFKPWGRLRVTRRFPGTPMPPQRLPNDSPDSQRQ